MDATPFYGFPFPETADPPTVPAHLEALAVAVEATAVAIATATDNRLDAIEQGTGAWTAFVPTLTQGAATPTKTVNYAQYCQIGRTVHARVSLTCTSVGLVNNIVAVGLPVAAAADVHAAFGPVGTILINDVGTGFFHGAAMINGAVGVVGIVNAATAFMGQTGGGFIAALAVNDVVTYEVTYEAAA